MTAAKDFESIASYIENQSGPIESQEVVTALQNAVDGLAVLPHRHQQLGDNPNSRRCLCKGFFIVYDISDKNKAVKILRILRQRRDRKRLR